MSLLVPPEIKKDIKVHSGYVTLASRFGRKNLKGLFLLLENRVYLTRELYSMLTNDHYVNDVADSLQVRPIGRDRTVMTESKASIFKPYFKELSARMQVLIEAFPLPHREDILVSNPVQQLNNLNRDFLVNTSRTIIASPDSLIPNYFDFDYETGSKDSPE